MLPKHGLLHELGSKQVILLDVPNVLLDTWKLCLSPQALAPLSLMNG